MEIEGGAEDDAEDAEKGSISPEQEEEDDDGGGGLREAQEDGGDDEKEGETSEDDEEKSDDDGQNKLASGLGNINDIQQQDEEKGDTVH